MKKNIIIAVCLFFLAVPCLACSLVDDTIKAPAQGDAKAQFDLGMMYFNKPAVPNNEIEAVRWFRKAAEQGYAMAQSNLGWE